MRGKMIIVALAAVLAMGGWAMAATSANVTITFTVEYLAISVDTTEWLVGSVAAGSTTQRDTAITVTNDGNIAEDFQVAQTCGTGMTSGTTLADVGLNKYVLAGKVAGTKPDVGGYVDGDVITATPATPSGASDIAASANVKLWPLLKAPTSVDDTAKGEQTVILAISCQKH